MLKGSYKPSRVSKPATIQKDQIFIPVLLIGGLILLIGLYGLIHSYRKRTQQPGMFYLGQSGSTTNLIPTNPRKPLQMGSVIAGQEKSMVMIQWRTNQASYGSIHYGYDEQELPFQLEQAAFERDHKLAVPLDSSQARLYFRIHSSSEAGQEAISPVYNLKLKW